MAAIQRSLALVAVLLVAGCATSVPTQALNEESANAVRTVAVIVPPDPLEYAVFMNGHPGLAFGLIGGAIAGADQVQKSKQYTVAVQSAKFSLSGTLGQAMVEKLTAAGYEARLEQGPWELEEGALAKRYRLQFDRIQSDADAVLVVMPVFVGYMAASPVSPYLPTVRVFARLLAKDRKTDLYRGAHFVGAQPTFGEGWKKSADLAAKFSTFDTLIAQTGESVQALHASVQAISLHIAQDLRRKSVVAAPTAVGGTREEALPGAPATAD